MSNTKRYLRSTAVLLALVFVGLFLLNACAALDARRHCTHPHHEEWVRERQAKGRPF